MAQRVFSGMLNESLSIIVARFIHGRPSVARSMQFWADAFNVLCCTAHLALHVCVSGDEMIGRNLDKLSTYARDIHAKCNELLICLLLRGAPLKVLFQVFRKGLDNLTISKPRWGPSPWLYICAPNLFGMFPDKSKGFQHLNDHQSTILELNVLKSQPQPNWTQLIKVLSMNDYLVARTLLNALVHQCQGQTSVIETAPRTISPGGTTTNPDDDDDKCGGFLCTGRSCKRVLSITPAMSLHALSYILASTSIDPSRVLVPAIKKDPAWSTYLDRQQMWNQARPPWLNALIAFVRPIMTPIVNTLLEAAKTGASIYQAMSLALGCLGDLYECLPLGVLRIALVMDESIPAHCKPMGGSVVLQLMCSALYTALLSKGEVIPESARTSNSSRDPRTPTPEAIFLEAQNRAASAIGLSEALCSLDSDNKHTAQIDELLNRVRACVERKLAAASHADVDDMMCVIEVYTDRLAFTQVGRRSLKILHECLVRCSDALLDALQTGKSDAKFLGALQPVVSRPLTYTMFHIGEAPFDRLLCDYESAIDWERLFDVPLAVNNQRIRAQVLARPELVNILQLGTDEREAANFVKQICSAGAVVRRG